MFISIAHRVPLLFAAALASSLAAPCASAQPAKRATDRWALLIGVDDYTHAKPLRYCGADQLALAKELVARGFPQRQVYLMYDKAQKKRDLPFKENIEERIEQVLGFAERDDLVLVAFSGHGVHLKGKSYLCPTSARLDDTKTLVSLDWLYEQLKNCPAALKLVLVDACRNDPSLEGERSFSNASRQFAAAARPPEGTLLLTSCTEGEVSREDEEFGHGVFMHYLLEGLKGGADANGDRKVTLNELFDFSGKETKLHVDEKFRGSQRPKMRGEFTLEAMSFEIGTLASSVAASARPTLPRPNASSKPAKAGETITNSIGMKLALIPAGEFWMGAADEKPRHRVRITQPFYMGVYEVTQREYEQVMGENPSYFASGGKGAERVSGLDTARFPVEQVSWDGAREFCRKLSALPGEKSAGNVYRLPTETEWEYACRAGTTTAFHFGGQLNGKQANADGNHPCGTSTKGPYLARTTTVGQYGRNEFGLCDMHGNVWEWCSDWYDKDYYSASPSTDPQGPSAGSFRVIRGGGWGNFPGNCSFASRDVVGPAYRNDDAGFRVVRAR